MRCDAMRSCLLVILRPRPDPLLSPLPTDDDATEDRCSVAAILRSAYARADESPDVVHLDSARHRRWFFLEGKREDTDPGLFSNRIRKPS